MAGKQSMAARRTRAVKALLTEAQRVTAALSIDIAPPDADADAETQRVSLLEYAAAVLAAVPGGKPAQDGNE